MLNALLAKSVYLLSKNVKKTFFKKCRQILLKRIVFVKN